VSERPDTAGVTQKARAELTAKDTPNGTVADYVKSVLEHETDLTVQFAGEHDKLMVLAKDRDEWKERCKGALDYDDTLKMEIEDLKVAVSKAKAFIANSV
jgi:hypothetical protein